MSRAPGINHWLPLPYGQLGAFLRDPLGFQRRARERYGDVFRFRIGPLLVHYLYHPDHVRRVLFDRPKNYLRGWHYQLLRKLLGENLVVSEGDYWMRQRRLAQAAFLRPRLAGYADVMVDATNQLLARWRQRAAAGEAVDVGPEMSRVALAIAGRTFFDRDVSDAADAVGRSFAVAAAYLEYRFNRPFTTPPAWVPTPTNVRFRRAVRTLNELVLALIRERRHTGRDHGDLLSRLLGARDEETGQSMSDAELASEVLTFLLAGHETSATALTWTWFCLATRPALRERLRAEAWAAFGERTPTADDAARLPLCRMVLDEALRLYPPIWAVPRQPVEDDTIDGYRIPARSTVALCPFITHRHPAAWDDPETFDPDRFTPERVALRPKGAYFPFLGGPHQCIGNEFALLEMRLVVALVLRTFDLELLPGPAIEPRGGLALRPSAPVRVRLKWT